MSQWGIKMSLFLLECLTVGNQTVFFKYLTLSHQILPGKAFQKTSCNFQLVGLFKKGMWSLSQAICTSSSLAFQMAFLESWRLLTDQKNHRNRLCESTSRSRLEMMLWLIRTRMSPVVYWEFQKHPRFTLCIEQSSKKPRKIEKNPYLSAPLNQMSTTLRFIVIIFP